MRHSAEWWSVYGAAFTRGFEDVCARDGALFGEQLDKVRAACAERAGWVADQAVAGYDEARRSGAILLREQPAECKHLSAENGALGSETRGFPRRGSNVVRERYEINRGRRTTRRTARDWVAGRLLVTKRWTGEPFDHFLDRHLIRRGWLIDAIEQGRA